MVASSLKVFGFALLAGLAGTSSASAQRSDDEVVARLARFGRMMQDDASDIVSAVSAQLVGNARRGGDEYDRMRQMLGVHLFRGPNGGPGRTRDEYRERLAQVLGTMSRGLSVPLMEAYFSGEDYATVCTEDFGLMMSACDALHAASLSTDAPSPYLPPDDGRSLSRSLTASGVPLADAEQLVAAVRSLVLGVPRSLLRNGDDRELTRLLRECPGALTSRVSQLRAWHAGPTEGMVRCLVAVLADGQRDEAALRRIGTRLRLSRPLTLALAQWATTRPNRAEPPTARPAPSAPVRPAPAPALPAPAPAPVAAAPAQAPVPTVASLLEAGDRAFSASQFADAEASYRQALTLDSNQGPALARLGAALTRLGRGAEAVEALSRAVQRIPRRAPAGLAASLYVALGEAYEAAQDPRRARASFQRATQLERSNVKAREGLARLDATEQAASAQATAARAEAEGPDANTWRSRGRSAFRARRYDMCIRAYQEAVRLEPAHPGGHAALGACHLLSDNAAGAIASYQEAARLEPTNAAFHAALGESFAKAERAEDARASYRRALELDAQNRVAQAGIRRLPEAPPQLPESPSREMILMVMRGLQLRVQSCMPTRTGVIKFKLTVQGETGMVEAAVVSGGDFLAAMEGSPEADCALAVVQGATFPRFTRPSMEFEYPYNFVATQAPPPPPAEAPSAPVNDFVVP
jgi:tetratricopeptide (TPR) repeat protein